MEQKKYFISADLEGITDVTAWCETEKGEDGYEAACLQMSQETAVACEAVLEAGYEAVVRDGHLTARNIHHEMLPRGVKLMRGWACCRLAREEVPDIGFAAVKECRGNSTFNLHPQDACSLIKEQVALALKCERTVPEVPPELKLEVSLIHHQAVRSALVHPLIQKVDDSTVCYTAHSPRELNAILSYIIG